MKTFADLEVENPTMRRAPLLDAELVDGVRVRVLWSGGNGPHAYTIKRIDGNPWAALQLPGSAELWATAPLGPCDLVEIIPSNNPVTERESQ